MPPLVEAGDLMCTHHMVIPEPAGPTSLGVCKFCGDEREFANSERDDYIKRSVKAHKRYITAGAAT